MASHRSPVAACRCTVALLLLAAVLFTTAELEERAPHVEPADEGGYRTYIVQLKQPRGGQDADADLARAWHQSFLPSMTTALGKQRLLYSYKTVFTGFAARLTEEELKEVSAKPGFVRSFPTSSITSTTSTRSLEGNGFGSIDPSEPWKGSCRQDMKYNGELMRTKNMYDPGYLASGRGQ